MSPSEINKQYKIAFFLADDYTWNFPTYLKTVTKLKAKHKVAGTWIFPDLLVNKKGVQIPLWYLDVFGVKNFFIICTFDSHAVEGSKIFLQQTLQA